MTARNRRQSLRLAPGIAASAFVAAIAFMLYAQGDARNDSDARRRPRPRRGAGRDDPANANADLSPKPPVAAADAGRSRPSASGCRRAIGWTPVLSDPLIEDPAQIAFDGNGRMFVVELRGYFQTPEGIDLIPPIGRISMHEDRDNDGIYEHHTVFVDKLVFPRFVMPFGANTHSDDGDQRRRSVEVHRIRMATAWPTRRSCLRRISAAPGTWSHSRPACSGRWTTGCTAPSTRSGCDGRRTAC